MATKIIDRIQVRTHNTTFWVKDPKKIAMYIMLSQQIGSLGYTPDIIKKVYRE